jgi:hypothetical protein
VVTTPTEPATTAATRWKRRGISSSSIWHVARGEPTHPPWGLAPFGC